MKILIAIILLSTLVQSQIPNPPVPMPGRIGPGGNYPLFNGGTIQISGNYTMTFPDMSASVIRFTGTLSAPATITAPTSGTNPFGFEFTIQNATTGNQNIIVKGATGNGVTIPNGQTMMVIYDGANYVSVGAPSTGIGYPGAGVANSTGSAWGTSYSASNQFPANFIPTLNQSTTGNAATATQFQGTPTQCSDAQFATGIARNGNANCSTPSSSGGGGDGITHNAAEYGVKADGRMYACYARHDSHNVVCYDTPLTKPPTHVAFTQADVGKLMLIYAVGTGTGNVRGTMSVASCPGCSGGTDGLQPVFFTDEDDGCSSRDDMPYAYVHVVGGVPTGDLVMPVFRGDKCTRAPTQGTVGTVNGTAHFTGGYIQAGDLPTRITQVIDNNTVVVADLPSISKGDTYAMFGTDDVAGWEAACAANQNGHITFAGASLVSRGINCDYAGFHLEGKGYLGFAKGQDGITTGSILIYAGRGNSPPYPGGTAFSQGRDHILLLHAGMGAKVERVGFRGNSVAQPFALKLSFGRYAWGFHGPYISQGTLVDQVWFGSGGGDPPVTFGNSENQGHWSSYQLQSCVYGDSADVGNVDFVHILHSYCLGAEVGFDANNAQATAWTFDKIHIQTSNIGTAVWGGQWWNDYYTESNRLDIMMGSPTDASTYLVTMQMTYGGESSTQAIAYPTHIAHSCCTGEADIDATGLGLPRYDGTNPFINPWGIWIDLVPLRVGTFRWRGNILNQGKIQLQNYCGQGGVNYWFEDAPYAGGVQPAQVVWAGNTYLAPACEEGLGGQIHWHSTRDGHGKLRDVQLDVMQSGSKLLDAELENDNWYQKTIGSILVRSPRPPGQYRDLQDPYSMGGAVQGAGGSTTRHYVLTCSDGGGREVNASPTITVPNGPASLSNANNIVVYFKPHRGCSDYNLYGDSGSGGIGYLTSARSSALDGYWFAPFNSLAFYDTGVWPKDTGRTPPPVSTSGVIDAEHGYLINSQPLASTHLADFVATAPTNGQVPVFNAGLGKYVPGAVSGGDGAPSGGITSINNNSNAAQHIVAGQGIQVESNSGTTTITNIAMGNGGGGGGGSLSNLSGLTGNHVLDNYNSTFSWFYQFSNNSEGGFTLGERAASPVYGKLLGISTFADSLTSPLWVTAHGYDNGMRIDPWGNINATGSAKFVGNLQLPVPQFYHKVLVTDGQGNITPASDIGEISSLRDATKPNQVLNSAYRQTWKWNFGSAWNAGLMMEESAPSTAGGALLFIDTVAGSMTDPLEVRARGYDNGVSVTAAGDLVTAGTAKLVGPVRLPSSLANKSALGTDQDGNIIEGSGGGSTSFSSLLGATANHTVNNLNHQQDWLWSLTGSDVNWGLAFHESSASTNTNPVTALVTIWTDSGSTIWPFRATNAVAGMGVAPDGNVKVIGPAKFVGPVQPAGTHAAGSIACFKDDGTLGSCHSALSGDPPTCTCQ